MNINLGRTSLFFARVFTDTYGARKVRILILKDCTTLQKKRVNELMVSGIEIGYEPILSVTEEDEHVRVCARIEKEAIRELVCCIIDEQEIVMVQVCGKIDPNEVSKLMGAYGSAT